MKTLGGALGLLALLFASNAAFADEVSGAVPIVAAPVEGGPPAPDASDRRQTHRDVQNTVDRYKKSLPQGPLEDPTALPDPSDIPTVIGGQKGPGWVPSQAETPAPAAPAGAKTAPQAAAEPGLPILRAGDAEPKVEENPSEPSGSRDLLAAARVFTYPFEALGLKIGMGADRRPRILHRDGSPASEDELKAAGDEVRREPRALQKFRNFFSLITRNKFTELKRDYQARLELRPSAFLHVELSEDQRDFRWSQSCEGVSEECNPFARSASYQRGKFVRPEDLAGIWGGLAKADGRPDPDALSARPARSSAPKEAPLPDPGRGRMGLGWYLFTGACLLVLWLWRAVASGTLLPPPEKGTRLVPIIPSGAPAEPPAPPVEAGR